MAVTLAEAQVNTQDDVDFTVIDETRRRSWLLDQITFDDVASPGTGGGTLTYGYTRLVTPAPSSFRALNTEYTVGKAARQRYTVDLSPLGGKFEVDRVLATLGERRTSEVSFQMSQLITSVRTRFQDEVINGTQTTASGGDKDGAKVGFDGLDSSLAGSSTELSANAIVDWTAATVNSESAAHTALDTLDEFVDTVDGEVQAIMGNKKSMARLRSIARRAGYYTRSEDALGRTVEMYGNSVLIDLGDGPDGTPIIPIETRTVGGTPTDNLTDLYAVRFGLDSFHGVSVANSPLVRTWLPDFSTSGAVKPGEMEMGPVAMALKRTKSAAVLRNIQLAASA